VQLNLQGNQCPSAIWTTNTAKGRDSPTRGGARVIVSTSASHHRTPTHIFDITLYDNIQIFREKIASQQHDSLSLPNSDRRAVSLNKCRPAPRIRSWKRRIPRRSRRSRNSSNWHLRSRTLFGYSKSYSRNLDLFKCVADWYMQ